MPGKSKAIFHSGGMCFFAIVDLLHISLSARGYVMKLVARGCADTRDHALFSEQVPRKRTKGYKGGGTECKCLLSKSQKLYTRLNDQEWIQQTKNKR